MSDRGHKAAEASMILDISSGLQISNESMQVVSM